MHDPKRIIVKAASYLAMVRPQLEYASIVWEPSYYTELKVFKEEQQDGC